MHWSFNSPWCQWCDSNFILRYFHEDTWIDGILVSFPGQFIPQIFMVWKFLLFFSSKLLFRKLHIFSPEINTSETILKINRVLIINQLGMKNSPPHFQTDKHVQRPTPLYVFLNVSETSHLGVLHTSLITKMALIYTLKIQTNVRHKIYVHFQLLLGNNLVENTTKLNKLNRFVVC